MNYFNVATSSGTNHVALNSHSDDEVLFAKIDSLLHERMLSFDPNYGPYLVEHSEDVKNELHALLIHLNKYDQQTARLLSEDAFGHDVGKTHRNQTGLWRISQDKIVRTLREEQERPKHSELGPRVITDEILPALHTTWGNLSETSRDRLLRRFYMCENHHDRFDQHPEMGEIMRALCVVDALSGKKKATGNDLGLALTSLEMDAKHAGQLDTVMLGEYRKSLIARGKIREARPSSPSPLANPSVS